MQRKIIEYTYYWAERIGVEVKTIKFRKYSRTMGKAFSSKKEIRYNKKITQLLTRKEQNYLALHEVVHLATSNHKPHGKEWQMIMTMFMPNWRKIRYTLGIKRKKTLLRRRWVDAKI